MVTFTPGERAPEAVWDPEPAGHCGVEKHLLAQLRIEASPSSS
jgi:hypothetical protein